MKLLLLFLLFPCCMQAQRFVVKDWTMCKCAGLPSYTVYLGNLEGTVIVSLDITDDYAPTIRDTVFYDGQNWRWKKQFLHLYGNPGWEVLPSARRNNRFFAEVPMLYIVDGFKTIDRALVDSLIRGKNIKIKVLKDADATAIYGSRAENGATIIKTKQ